MKYRPKEIQYPTRSIEYHITTPSGVVSRIFEDKRLADKHARTMPIGWKVIKTTILKEDVTPQEIYDRHGLMLVA